MAQPIIDFGKAIPADVRSWARILRNINAFVSKVDSTFVLSEDTVLPNTPTAISTDEFFGVKSRSIRDTGQEAFQLLLLAPPKATRIDEGGAIMKQDFFGS